MKNPSLLLHRRRLLQAAAAPVLAGFGANLLAQGAGDSRWPAKPVRFVVPFSAGGVADVIARVVGKGLSDRWGQPVTVENLTGAGGNIGMADVLRHPADGYNMVLAPGGNLTINPHYLKEMPFDVVRDFDPVTVLADSPNVLVVSPKLGVKTVRELIAAARKLPNGLTYASPGDGSTQHLAGALFGIKADCKVLHVPYRGFAPALTDVMSGQVDMIFVATATVAPHVREGKLVALAIAGPKRTPSMPDVPSMQEAGVSDFDANSWYGVVVRKGTPEAVRVALNRDINEVLKAEAERMKGLGLVPSGKGLQQFADIINEESSRWKAVMAKANIGQK